LTVLDSIRLGGGFGPVAAWALDQRDRGRARAIEGRGVRGWNRRGASRVGLPSLYEQSTDKDGRIWGLPNWRLPDLQRAIVARRRRRRIGPAALFKVGRFDDARATLEAAFFGAGAAAHDDLALSAANSLAWRVGHQLAQSDVGQTWVDIAQMLATRFGLPDDDLLSAALHHNAGAVLEEFDVPAALVRYGQALAIRERLLGPDHPRVASTLNNIAAMHNRSGDYPAARALLERAIAITERALGPDHPETAMSVAGLANVLEHLGERAEAEALHGRALTIIERASGSDHPNVAQSLWERAGLRDHPLMAAALGTAASIEEARGDWAAARARRGRALEILELDAGVDHPRGWCGRRGVDRRASR